MLRFLTEDVVRFSRLIELLRNYLNPRQKAGYDPFNVEGRKYFSGELTDLKQNAQALGLLSCVQQVSRLQRLIDFAGTKEAAHANVADQFDHQLEDLSMRLIDSLEERVFLSLSSEEVALYDAQQPLFGKEVADRFPTKGAFEIDEAAKCLALGRATAAVFHLMRVMEVGIGTLARALDISDPIKPAERNWGIMLGKIWDGIEAKWPRVVDRAKGDGEFFESLHASLDAVKNPWRNSAMHVETKYTSDEAEHIFVAVKGFMKKLASRVDESGKPLA